MGQRDTKSQRKQDAHETERAGHKGDGDQIMGIEGLWSHRNLGEHQWNVPHVIGWVQSQCHLDCKFRIGLYEQ